MRGGLIGYERMKVVVTGAAGNLGRAVCRRLKEASVAFSALDLESLVDCPQIQEETGWARP